MGKLLTNHRLRELLVYDHNTGLFVWIKKPAPRANRVKVGSVAGQLDPAGYIRIRIDGKAYWAHRLAWFYVHDNWPSGVIDHRDGIRANNAIHNLRVCEIRENIENQTKPHRDGSSGFLGVHHRKDTGKFSASIMAKRKMIHLGSFPTAEEAHAEYVKAKRILHKFCTI